MENDCNGDLKNYLDRKDDIYSLDACFEALSQDIKGIRGCKWDAYDLMIFPTFCPNDNRVYFLSQITACHRILKSQNLISSVTVFKRPSGML